MTVSPAVTHAIIPREVARDAGEGSADHDTAAAQPRHGIEARVPVTSKIRGAGEPSHGIAMNAGVNTQRKLPPAQRSPARA